MWRLHGSGEWKFVRGVWFTWPRWPPRPYIVISLQKSSSPKPKGQWPCVLECSIVALGPSWFVQTMTLGWPWSILRQGQFCLLYAFIWGKPLESNLMFDTYSKWPEWEKVCLYKNSDPKGLSAPGLYTCIKTWKIMYKISFKDIFLKLATNGQSDMTFLLTSGFCPQ